MSSAILRSLALGSTWCLAVLPCLAQRPGPVGFAGGNSNLSSRNPPARQLGAINDPFVAAISADASLNDLAVVSEDRVYAAGDRGAILATNNSGQTWTQLQTGTTANLHGIVFLNDRQGLAVGGWIGSYTSSSHGVILRTGNGGQTWEQVPCDQLPRLTGVRAAGGRLIAWGDYSPSWKTSLFESADGGVTWRGIPAPIGHAAAVGSSLSGVICAVDRLGRSYFSVQDRDLPEALARPDAALHCIHHTGQRWIACGESGELISSLEGREWINISLPLSASARRFCVWRTIEQVGDEIWVGGAPGSIFLHSADRGVSWQVRSTDQTLPIRAIRFLDHDRGWAVGPLNLVLATRDGGRSWYPQQQACSRVGLLSVVRHQDQVPWCPMVATVWGEQIATASLVLNPEEPARQAGFLPSQATVREAIAPQLGLAEHRAWSSDISDRSATTAAQRLAIELMIWRPDVVLTSELQEAAQPDQQTDFALSAAVLSALKLSEQTAQDNALAQELDLPAWAVSKLVVVTEPGSGLFSEQNRRILNSPGLSVWDLLLPLPPEDRDRSASVSMRTVWARSQAKSTSTSLLGGLAPTDATSRKVATDNLGNYQLVMGRVHRDRSVQQLLDTPDGSRTDEQWTRDLDFVFGTLPEREIAPAGYKLVQGLSAPRHWRRKQIVLQRLHGLLPRKDVAEWARLLLLKLTASDEMAAWLRSHTDLVENESDAVRMASGIARGEGSSRSRAGRPPVVSAQTSATSAVWNATPFGDGAPTGRSSVGNDPAVVSAAATTEVPVHLPARRALEREELPREPWFEQLSRYHRVSPKLRSRPDIELLSFRLGQLPAQAQDPVVEAVGRLEASSARQLLGWPQVVQQELRFQTNQVDQLKWVALAARAERAPVLDGELREPMWNRVPAMRLSAIDQNAGPPTTLRWAYDEHYLYIGAECMRHEATEPSVLKRVRTYDSDLSGLDHVRVSLDTDRDYNTAIEMAVAEDGGTFDRCCGLAAYNPKWHVYVQPERSRWTAEIAIELTSLTTNTDLVGRAWATSALRTGPNGPPQSWSQIKTHQPQLHGSGLLLFMHRTP